jgi:hypothetical protein
MRTFAASLLALLLMGLAAGKLSSQTASTHVVTPAEYERWKKDLPIGAAGARTTRSAPST